jgi:hypothetical protein
LTGPAARIPAETPKAVNVRLARETMEPRQTEFMSQGRHSRQRPFPSRVQSEKALDVAFYEICDDLGWRFRAVADLGLTPSTANPKLADDQR